MIGFTSLDSGHILQGLYNREGTYSITTGIGNPTLIYLSAFNQGNTRSKAERGAEDCLETFISLIPGCRYTDSDLRLEPKKYSALAIIQGIPRIDYHAEVEELLNLMSASFEATMILNVSPVKLAETPSIELGTIPEHRKKALLNEEAFLVSIYVYFTNDDKDMLEKDLKTFYAQYGSVYDSQHSNLQMNFLFNKRAIKTLQRALFGDISHSSLLTNREAQANFQFSKGIGLEKVHMTPDFHMPLYTDIEKGEFIPVGTCLDRYGNRAHQAYFNPEDVYSNVGIWGMIGFGKTSFTKDFVLKLIKYGIKFIIFDPKNHEYLDLPNLIEDRVSNDVIVLNPVLKSFSLNPLEIPPTLTGRQREIAIMHTIENFISLLRNLGWVIGEVQEQRLRKWLNEIYSKGYPQLISVLVSLLKTDKKTKVAQDEDNLPVKLEALATGFQGELFNRNTTLPFDLIENTKVTIFDLTQLPAGLKSLYPPIFMNYWWNYRQQHGKADLNRIFLLEESPTYSESPIISTILTQGRALKQGLIFIHQGLYQVQDHMLRGEIIRNTVTKFNFRTVYRRDNMEALASMGLSNKWLEHMSNMKTREVVVSLKDKPVFKIYTDDYPDVEPITDEEVKELSENILLPLVDGIEKDTEFNPNSQNLKKKLIQLLYENPYSPTSEAINRLGIMKAKGYELKKEMLEEGLLIEEKVRTGVGRPRNVLGLTKAAYDLIDVENQGVPAHHGSFEHIIMVNELAQLLEDHLWAVTPEWNMTDIKAEGLNKKVAVEVETCKDYNPDQITRNIQRDLRWADLIVIVSPNQQTQTKIKRLVKQLGIEKVELLTYTDVREKIIGVIE